MILDKTCLLGALALMVACGPMNEGNLASTLVQDKLAPLMGLAPSPKPPAVPAVDVANAATGEVLLVKIISRNAVAPMTRLYENGKMVTWVSPGQVSMTFNDGILIATRGLNEDLMGAEIKGVRAALAAGGGATTRTHSFLDSEDQIQRRQMSCTITADGKDKIADLSGTRVAHKYTENCLGPVFGFANSYWLDTPGGLIVQSYQAVAPTVGFIQVNSL